MRSHITKLVILLIITSWWPMTGSLVTAEPLPSPTTIVVDGGGQSAFLQAVNQAQPGDTVLVKPGVYDDGNPEVEMEITIFGTEDAPILIKGEGRPRLGVTQFDGSEYVIIEGFEIANQTTSNFFIGLDFKNSSYITARDMLIHDLTAAAVGMGGGTDITIEDSTIYNLSPRLDGNDATCFINSTTTNLTLRNNVCYDYIGDGYQARPDGASSRDRGTTVIEGNTFFNSPEIAPCSENALDIKAEAGTMIVRSNEFYGFTRGEHSDKQKCPLAASGCTVCYAINIQDNSTGTFLIEDNYIHDSVAGIFNTHIDLTVVDNVFENIEKYPFFDHSTVARYYHNTIINVGDLSQDTSNHAEWINNLFFNVGSTVQGDYHHNGWFGDDQRRSGIGDVVGSDDPHLASDFMPPADSPLIDAGAMGFRSGYAGAAPDIGAREAAAEAPPSPTPSATPSPTSEPTPSLLTVTFNGPDAVTPGQTFNLNVEAQDVAGAGLYGAQLEINYDPNLISVDNLQVNPDLSFVLRSSADNTAGKIILVASREGDAPGLTGDVNLLTFQATAATTSGNAALSFENVKVSDPQAAALEVETQDHNVTIGEAPTPEPTEESTPEPTDEPTPQPTDEPTPEPTDEPTTATVSGQVILAGRVDNNWSEAAVVLEGSDPLTATTDTGGNFTVVEAVVGTHTSITAAAVGYLSAICNEPSVAAPETGLLPVTLLSGDIVADDVVDITDATAVGVGFYQAGADLPADINRDGFIDIFDLVLVTVNFGKSGPQTWNC